MLQGTVEKIQVQLLLANLALQLGDLSPRLGQAIRLGPRSAHALRRKDLWRARAPTFARQRLRAVRAEPVTPVIDNRSDTGGEIRKALKRFYKYAFQLRILRICC